MNFQGAGVALITPFKNGSIDINALKNSVEFQISNHTDYIVALGTTGEPATMTRDEKLLVMETVKEKIGSRVPLVIGCGCNNTQEAVVNAKFASAYADALLVVTPYYNKCTQKGIVEHYRAIADAVSLPIIAYNVPGRTGVNILPQTVKTLADENIISAVKEASGNVEQVMEISRLAGDKIAVISGDDGLILPIISVGGQGVISVASNVIPSSVSKLCKLALSGDYKAAREIQFEINPLIKLLFCEVNPIPVKAACALMGMCNNELRLPLTVLSEENMSKLAAKMQEMKLI